MATDISIRNLQTKVPIRLPRIKQVARRTLEYFNVRQADLSIVFISPVRMRALNTAYLNHPYVTDILTFNYSPPLLLRRKFIEAEIIIAPSVAVANAKMFGSDVAGEIDLYIIHGLLHVMGYDDHDSRDIVRMRKKERELADFVRKAPRIKGRSG